MLPAALEHWLYRTPPGPQVDAVQAVEADRAPQEPGADEIRLMHGFGSVPHELRIRLPSRLVAAWTPPDQPPPTEDAADGAHRGPWIPPQRFELPADRLSAVKQPLLLETLADRYYRLLQLAARAPGAFVWPAGPLPKPLGIARAGASQPLVEPLPRVTHRGTDRRGRLSGQRSLDSAAAIALLLLVHACLRVWRQSTVYHSPAGSHSRPSPMS